MKRNNQSRPWLVCAALAGGLTCGAFADIPSSPYDAIVTRNPFGLKPPPPPPPPPDENLNKPPPGPLADVTLTGITSILSKKLALFEIIPAPGKPAIKPILGEGERVEAVEVVSINMGKNEVTIKIGSITTNMTFKVAKSPPAAPAPAPGVVNPLVPSMAPPVQTTGFKQDLQGGGRRDVVVAGGGGAPTGASTVAPPVNTYGGGGVNPAGFGGASNPNAAYGDAALRSIPPRTVRQSPQTDAHNTEQREVNRAVQYLQMKVSEEAARQKGVIYPPTPPLPE